MKTHLPSTLAAILAASMVALVPAANASPRGCPSNSGGHGYSGHGGYSGHISTGNVSFAWNSGSYNRGYSHLGGARHVEESRPSFTETCRLIDTRYFTRGCDRYAKKTYLHERVDCHGEVVKCWKTCETVRVGGHRRH